MDSDKLFPLFEALLSTIRSRVEECKSQNRVGPEMTLVTRRKVDEMRSGEAGPRPSRYHIEHALVQEWRRAEVWVFEQLKHECAYLSFCAEVSQSIGKDMRQELDDAIRVSITSIFANEPFDSRESLGLLLRAIQEQPVPAWSDIDVWGIILKTKTMHLDVGTRRLLFRQLDVSDFEQECVHALPDHMRNLLKLPDSILRVQMDTARNMDLQSEPRKILVLLRVLTVCSVDFSQEVHDTSNPFARVGPAHIDGTSCPGQVRHGRHNLTLTDGSKEKLARF